ncbi:uncharacterized protein B0I36DRAFT_327893 [Microdochium trichocladiopsis]|uniref:Uncharacterized protein n=1 Tax=Microdochium trichocladiopsis TaxID=1682393 RepID=A0A9P8Y3F3_9PEZI|nr:uncharacterized protein B0I36DRAFT_327893 [Microdochium trichocladiopsis]KAH7027779.1 hypothetical protein B0I36DRAFT_327893 [Microdochium trichocladiopsis]
MAHALRSRNDNDQVEDSQWENCDWFDRAQTSWNSDLTDTCLSGCPNDMVRVAMDGAGGDCSRGARARCCQPGYRTTTIRNDPRNDEFESLLHDFVADPDCDKWKGPSRYKDFATLKDHVTRLFYSRSATDRAIESWDWAVRPSFPNLGFDALEAWIYDDIRALETGSADLPDQILCNLAAYNSLVTGGSDGLCSATTPNDGLATRELGSQLVHLDKRAGEEMYDWEVLSPYLNYEVVRGTFLGLSYNQVGEWLVNDPIWNRVYGYGTRFCDQALVTAVAWVPGFLASLRSEHIFERSLIARFAEATIGNELFYNSAADNVPGVPRRASRFGAMNPTFWTRTMISALPFVTTPLYLEGSRRPDRRIAHHLGTRSNPDVLVLLPDSINVLKSQVWRLVTIRTDNSMNGLLASINSNPAAFLNVIRDVLGVVTYANNVDILQHFSTIVGGIRTELGLADEAHQLLYGVYVQAVARFDEWLHERFILMSARVQEFALRWLAVAIERFTNHQQFPVVYGDLRMLQGLAAGIKFNVRGIPGQPGEL